MKFKQPVSVNILSPRTLREPEHMLRAITLYCEKLPFMLPQRWNWGEPYKFFFDAESPRKIAYTVTGQSGTFYWGRRHKPKTEGSFHTGWRQLEPQNAPDMHSNIIFDTELEEFDQDAVVAYVKAASADSGADLAFIDSMTENYKEFAHISNSGNGSHFFITVHVLRHWLPDIFWATVFGPAYVKLFGMEKLLSVPAYRVEKLGDEMVYIQLSPSVRDLHTNFASVQVVRDKVKAHLGKEAFFDPDKAYDFRKIRPLGTPGTVFKAPNLAVNIEPNPVPLPLPVFSKMN